MNDPVIIGGNGANPPPRDYNLDVVVELTAAKGMLMSSNEEQTACAVIAQCILTTIGGQPPMMQERLIHMLDGKKFTINFQIVKINEHSSSNVS